MGSANWMKERREELRITQEQLAGRLAEGGLSVSKVAISKWETGKTPLPLQTPRNRRVIASALEVSIPTLLALAGYEIANEWSPHARIVATFFDSLSSAEQEMVYLLVTRLKLHDVSDLSVEDMVSQARIAR